MEGDGTGWSDRLVMTAVRNVVTPPPLLHPTTPFHSPLHPFHPSSTSMLLNHRPLHSSTTRCSLFHPSLLHLFHSSTSSLPLPLPVIPFIYPLLPLSSTIPFHPLPSQSLSFIHFFPLPFIVLYSTFFILVFHLFTSFTPLSSTASPSTLFHHHLYPPSSSSLPFISFLFHHHPLSSSYRFLHLYPPSLSFLLFVYFVFHLLRPTALSCSLSHLHLLPLVHFRLHSFIVPSSTFLSPPSTYFIIHSVHSPFPTCCLLLHLLLYFHPLSLTSLLPIHLLHLPLRLLSPTYSTFLSFIHFIFHLI